MKNLTLLSILLIITQGICFFICYYFLFDNLNGMYLHKNYIFIVLVGILLYFIPTFVASAINKKYLLQIFLLNLFLGFTFLGWLGALIWATFKTEAESIKGVFITIQIIVFLCYLAFCITDYHFYNYGTVNKRFNENMQILLDYTNNR